MLIRVESADRLGQADSWVAYCTRHWNMRCAAVDRKKVETLDVNFYLTAVTMYDTKGKTPTAHWLAIPLSYFAQGLPSHSGITSSHTKFEIPPSSRTFKHQRLAQRSVCELQASAGRRSTPLAPHSQSRVPPMAAERSARVMLDLIIPASPKPRYPFDISRRLSPLCLE